MIKEHDNTNPPKISRNTAEVPHSTGNHSARTATDLDTSMPDMRDVLSYFKIDYDSLTVVPLKDYKWNTFSLPNEISTIQTDTQKNINNFDESLTISQRIRSMTRQARTNTIK